MADEGFSAPSLEELMAKFAELPILIAETVQPASEEIASLMTIRVNESYPEKLAALWTEEARDASDAGILSEVYVGTTDYRVIGYEFGTSPHQEQANHSTNGKYLPAMLFQEGGQILFRYRTQHPGTPAHNLSPAIEEELGLLCAELWGAALSTTMLAALGFA